MAPREVDGCNKLWRRAGAEVQKFGVWPLGPQPAERGVSGHKKRAACGARETVRTAEPKRVPHPYVRSASSSSVGANLGCTVKSV